MLYLFWGFIRSYGIDFREIDGCVYIIGIRDGLWVGFLLDKCDRERRRGEGFIFGLNIVWFYYIEVFKLMVEMLKFGRR